MRTRRILPSCIVFFIAPETVKRAIRVNLFMTFPMRTIRESFRIFVTLIDAANDPWSKTSSNGKHETKSIGNQHEKICKRRAVVQNTQMIRLTKTSLT